MFLVKRDVDNPRYAYVEKLGDINTRRWGSRAEARVFGSREEAWMAATTFMHPGNQNVRVVRILPPTPCPSCNGTGRLRTTHPTSTTERK